MLESLIDAIDDLVHDQYPDMDVIAINPPVQYGWARGSNAVNLQYHAPDTVALVRSVVGGQIEPPLHYDIEAASIKQIADKIVNWLTFRRQ